METGASVVAMRDYSDGPARLLLFIDADVRLAPHGAASLAAAADAAAQLV